MAYDTLTSAQLAVEAREAMNRAENAMQAAMRRQDELIRRLAGAPVPASTPTPSTPFEGVLLAGWVVRTSGTHVDGEGHGEGAFRFNGNHTHTLADDPIVLPGQPGKSHLHTFWGNETADAHTTYETLTAAGGSGFGGPINRSSYWTPSHLIGDQLWLPDFIANYYKQSPAGSAHSPARDPSLVIGMPTGLKMRFGNPMGNVSQSPRARFDVLRGTELIGQGPTLADVAHLLTEGATLISNVASPECWNGELDSADHASHLVYPVQGKAPESHLWVIPTITYREFRTVPPGVDATTVRLSSDAAGRAAGHSYHGTFMEGWHPEAKALWQSAIERMLDCSGGDLGNGYRLKTPTGFTLEKRPNLVAFP